MIKILQLQSNQGVIFLFQIIIQYDQMNIFNNKGNQGTNIFSNNQPNQGGNNIFGGNQSNQGNKTSYLGNNIFANQQHQGNNLFNNNQQQQGTNIFGNNQSNQQRPNIFGGQQTGQSNTYNNQPSNNIFANNQQQNTNIFANQQQGNNIFNNQQQQGGNMFNSQQQTQQQMNMQSNWIGLNDTDRIVKQVQECIRHLDPKQLDFIRLDQSNSFANIKIKDLPQELREGIKIISNNMTQLKNAIDLIVKQNQKLNQQSAQFCRKVQQKLNKYKVVLIQNIQQTNLIEQVKSEVDSLEKQINTVLIPLYNAYKQNRTILFDSPDQFTIQIQRNIKKRFDQLLNKTDELLACTQGSDQISEQQASVVTVLQQLMIYYENVSAKVHQFTLNYNKVKRQLIEKNKRYSSYEETMRRIDEKVSEKMKKEFKAYDMIKEIEDILERKIKRERQAESERMSERRPGERNYRDYR